VAVHKPSHQSACQASVIKDSLPIEKKHKLGAYYLLTVDYLMLAAFW
jgi:hypothetical protein